jgi:hypothetical protein
VEQPQAEPLAVRLELDVTEPLVSVAGRRVAGDQRAVGRENYGTRFDVGEEGRERRHGRKPPHLVGGYN